MVAARAVAVVAALFWGVLFFGMIDLATVLLQDERFAEHYLLEAGWGLLYTGLVMVPLLVWAVLPRGTVLLQQVVAGAVGVAVTGLAAGALGQVLPAAGLVLSALVPAALAGRRLRPRRVSPAALHPLLAALALTGLAGAACYATAMVRAASAGMPDDETWGLMHLPMQAGFGVALAGCAVVVALAQAGGTDRWRVGVLPPALTAAGLGAFSLLYPDHLGSLGVVGGTACAAWGAALGASGVLVRDAGRRGRRAGASTPATA